MKALIFNSGQGSRMGDMTKDKPKCLVDIGGESILHRQLRILSECGIRDFIITTGKYHDEIAEESAKIQDINVELVRNPLYSSTNYIYSMYLAGEYIDSDMLILHGDLVFERKIAEQLVNDSRKDICLIDVTSDKPEKDFKGRIICGRLKEVSVEISDDDCYSFQPMYKLSKESALKWTEAVKRYVKDGKTGVYAENALNDILGDMNIEALSYSGMLVSEIDTAEDHCRVSREVKWLKE